MQNYFPPDATTTPYWLFTVTPGTTTVIPSGAKTILQIVHESSGNPSNTISCDGDIYKTNSFKAARNISFPLQYSCYGPLTLTQESSASASTQLVITWVPRIINATTTPNNMSTSTPYVEQCTYINNVEYCYKPIQAQIGYALWLIAALLMTYGIFKILK